MELDQKLNQGISAIVLLAIGFSLIAVIARYLGFFLTPLQQLYFAVAIGFLISLIVFPRTLNIQKLKNLPLSDWMVMLSRVFVGYIVGGSLYRAAISMTKISNVTFIQAIPFAALFGWIFFHEKMTFAKMALLIVSYIGVVIIAFQDFSSISSIGMGELFALISSAAFSFSYVARKWQSDQLNNTEITQILLLLGFIALFSFSLLKGEGIPSFEWNTLLVIGILITGFLNAANNLLINFGFKHTPAILASNLLTLEAIFALLLAFIFYHELPSIKEFTGGALIVCSVITMNYLGSQDSQA